MTDARISTNPRATTTTSATTTLDDARSSPTSTPAAATTAEQAREERTPATAESQRSSRRRAAGHESSRAQALHASMRTPANLAPMSERELFQGAHGGDVKALQQNLNAHGAHLDVDGKFGPKTEEALKAFQAQHGLAADGVCGPQTRKAIGAPGMLQHRGVEQMHPDQPGSSSRADGTATFDRITNRGALSQEVEGKITVNGRSYDFKSGGWGRGNLPPGEYTVSMPETTSENGMVRDGVGFRAALSNKYDPRVGDTRSALFIHPDGNVPGTLGCIGIQGNAAQLRQFRADLEAECRKHGGSFTLHVG